MTTGSEKDFTKRAVQSGTRPKKFGGLASQVRTHTVRATTGAKRSEFVHWSRSIVPQHLRSAYSENATDTHKNTNLFQQIALRIYTTYKERSSCIVRINHVLQRVRLRSPLVWVKHVASCFLIKQQTSKPRRRVSTDWKSVELEVENRVRFTGRCDLNSLAPVTERARLQVGLSDDALSAPLSYFGTDRCLTN